MSRRRKGSGRIIGKPEEAARGARVAGWAGSPEKRLGAWPGRQPAPPPGTLPTPPPRSPRPGSAPGRVPARPAICARSAGLGAWGCRGLRGSARPWTCMRLATGLLGLCETPDGTPAPSRMKVFLPMLLAALLGVDRAHSLVCFSCTNQNSNFYCLKPTVCSDSDNYCVTMSAAAGIGNIVDLGHSLNKGCSPICPGPPSVNLGVASVGVHCCQSFLCNISAADGGLRASATMLGLGLLLSLLSALLRLGP
ncbi:lymphocyte antigen 6E isoform X1 [Equus przewalskii]|uniref:Lymphocyte antigen 6 family member E n=3 Tax=Equus TaxID=9789 RepID=A0A9L0T710_HORSE